MLRRALLLAVAASWAVGAAALPDVRGPARARAPGHRTGAALTPGRARLGERVRYQGRVIVPAGVKVRWVPPAGGGTLTWGPLRAWKREAVSGSVGGRVAVADTFHVAAPLQAFVPGWVTVPGLEFEYTDPRNGARGEGRLPVVRLGVIPVVPPGDTTADLRPLRGPLAAPWWERVPWRVVIAAALALAAVLWGWRRLARRLRAAAPAVVLPALTDPAERALAELESLRGLALPEQGRFGEHAFHLTRIARGFLEAVGGGARPGHTTSELIARLEEAPLAGADVESLAALLRAWDLLKFARAASTAAEAGQAEAALESLVRRWRDARRGTESRVA